MSLNECTECRGQVSSLAAACPHCGAPVDAEESHPPAPIDQRTPHSYDAWKQSLEDEQISDKDFRDIQETAFGFTLEDRIEQLLYFSEALRRRSGWLDSLTISDWVVLKLHEMRRRYGCSHSNMTALVTQRISRVYCDEAQKNIQRYAADLPIW